MTQATLTSKTVEQHSNERPQHGWLISLALASGVVALCSAMVGAVYMALGTSLASSLQPPATIKFPTEYLVFMPIAIFGTGAIIQTRTWLASVLLMLLFVQMFPVMAVSGPSDRVAVAMALFKLRVWLGPVLVILCARVGWAVARRMDRVSG